MKKIFCLFIGFYFFYSVSLNAQPIIDPAHPGSKHYNFSYTHSKHSCDRRDVHLYLPNPLNVNTPVVVFGHGQSLDELHYLDTYLHLAQKGIAVIHPEYSTGFFDTNWNRMAKDFINLAQCILNKYSELNTKAVVFSGHSKGAYVAGVASGLAFKENLFPKPASVILMNAAGVDKSLIAELDQDIEMTVVYSDKDTIVKKDISDDLYKFSPSLKKQYINVISYPKSSGLDLKADHFWPLTKSTWLGGTTQNELHYYGLWKWLVSAAEDAHQGAHGIQPYLYGSYASDKGINGLNDQIIRNF